MKILRLTMEDSDNTVKPIYISMCLKGWNVDLPSVLKRISYKMLEVFDKQNNNTRHKDVVFNWKKKIGG